MGKAAFIHESKATPVWYERVMFYAWLSRRHSEIFIKLSNPW
jgi:hypothetical protein